MMKKIVFIFLLSALYSAVSAQTDSRIFYAQLMIVFSDIDKNFEYLKGEELSKQDGFTIYETIRSLEGTKDNIIISDSTHYQYRAVINDSVSYDGAKLILASWKTKLDEILSGMFLSATKFQSEKDPGTNGYQYSSEKIVVLLLVHKEENESYSLDLFIKLKQ